MTAKFIRAEPCRRRGHLATVTMCVCVGNPDPDAELEHIVITYPDETIREKFGGDDVAGLVECRRCSVLRAAQTVQERDSLATRMPVMMDMLGSFDATVLHLQACIGCQLEQLVAGRLTIVLNMLNDEFRRRSNKAELVEDETHASFKSTDGTVFLFRRDWSGNVQIGNAVIPLVCVREFAAMLRQVSGAPQ